MKIISGVILLSMALMSCKTTGPTNEAELEGTKKKGTVAPAKRALLVISCKESFASPKPNFIMNVVMPASGDKPTEYDASYESESVNWSFTEDRTRLETWEPSGETLQLFVNFGERMYSSLRFDKLVCDGQTKGAGEVSNYVGGFAGTRKSSLLNCLCTPP